MNITIIAGCKYENKIDGVFAYGCVVLYNVL